MSSKQMKTLTINGNTYEVMDEYARNHCSGGSNVDFKNEYSFHGIALADISEQHKDKYLTVNNAAVGSTFSDILSVASMSGHVVYTTEVESGDSIVATNAHTLASDYVPYMYVFDTESILTNIVSYTDLNSTKEYVFENDGFIYMCFDYTTVQAGEFFYIKKHNTFEPMVLYADKADTYAGDSTYGDKAMEAIMTGRQILVRVPNADGGKFTAVYSPIYMYQLPNYQNNYLYLFFLNDGTDSNGLPSYGQLKLLLSKTYNATPLS